MKGTIALCFKEMIEEKFGEEKWSNILRDAGLPPDKLFIEAEDVVDDDMMKVVGASCRTLGSTQEEAADSFGDYWVNVYSQKYYPGFYKAHASARDFILDMDRLHRVITQSVPNAHPPRFTFEWAGPDTLLITYSSRRHMIDFAVGLLKGVGRFYREKLSVRKLSEAEIEVKFG